MEKEKNITEFCLDEVFYDDGRQWLIKRTDFNAQFILRLQKEFENAKFDFDSAYKNGVEMKNYMWINIYEN